MIRNHRGSDLFCWNITSDIHSLQITGHCFVCGARSWSCSRHILSESQKIFLYWFANTINCLFGCIKLHRPPLWVIRFFCHLHKSHTITFKSHYSLLPQQYYTIQNYNWHLKWITSWFGHACVLMLVHSWGVNSINCN